MYNILRLFMKNIKIRHLGPGEFTTFFSWMRKTSSKCQNPTVRLPPMFVILSKFSIEEKV